MIDTPWVSHKYKILLQETYMNLTKDKAILCFPLEQVNNDVNS